MRTETRVDLDDRVLLDDGLVHLCDYISLNNFTHFSCRVIVADNVFEYRAVNKSALTCVICASRTR